MRTKYGELQLNQACDRLCGQLTRDDWDVGLEHITDHFQHMLTAADKKAALAKAETSYDRANIEDKVPLKESHSVFLLQYRNKKNLRDLLKEAAAKPSMKFVAMVDGKARGRIIRYFNKQIGTKPDETALLIIMDLEGKGRLITAYPITEPVARKQRGP
jgi:hypothetical protein